MSDLRGDGRRRGGLGPGPVAALVALAFVIGAALAVYLLHRVPRGTAAAVPPPARTLPAAVAPVASAAAAAIDPVTLATREGTLAAQLAAIEARTAQVDLATRVAGDRASRAEAMLTLAAARRAVEAGQPLGVIEPALRQRFGAADPAAVSVLLRAVRQPVTLLTLGRTLDAIAPDLLADGDRSWRERWQGELRRLIVIRRADAVVVTPAARLDRARLLLAGGDVAGARGVIAQLPGAAAASGWQAAAARYLMVHQALDRLERRAIAG